MHYGRSQITPFSSLVACRLITISSSDLRCKKVRNPCFTIYSKKLRDQQHIKIAPFGQLKFMQEFVYLGIYVRAGLSCKIAHGFGSSCLRSLQLSFKKSANLGSPAYAHRGQKVKRMNQSQTDQAFKDSVERQIR